MFSDQVSWNWFIHLNRITVRQEIFVQADAMDEDALDFREKTGGGDQISAAMAGSLMLSASVSTLPAKRCR